ASTSASDWSTCAQGGEATIAAAAEASPIACSRLAHARSPAAFAASRAASSGSTTPASASRRRRRRIARSHCRPRAPYPTTRTRGRAVERLEPRMSPPRTMLTPKQNSPARGGSPRISVVVPTLRRPEALAALLADLARCDPPPHEVVVVDGDRDGSARAPCAEAAIAVRYLGAPAAGGDVVLFVDDDVALAPDTFGLLAEAYRDPAVVGATGRVVGERSQIVPRGSP